MRLSAFFAELKRRKVYRVAVVYLAVGTAIAVSVPDPFQALGFPRWVAGMVIALVVLGFPVSLVLAWAYEIRPEEPRPSSHEAPSASQSPSTSEMGPANPVLTTLRGTAGTLEGTPRSLEDLQPSLPPRPSGDRRPAVAVLPFANLCTEPDSEYFSDGVTFDIINHLAKILDLKVISRTSVMRYRNTDKPMARIGRELGASAIVEGEVQRIGNRVRVSAQLVDASTDEHLWADQYDRELVDVFAIQSEVAQEVARALQATLASGEKERIERRPTENFEAYNSYLKGRYFWEKRGQGLDKGLEYFRRALEIDPEYALAYAGLSDCYALLAFYGLRSPVELLPAARTAALRALEIDDALAEAHSSLGWVRLVLDGDYPLAEESFRRAIELNPNYTPARYWYASALLPTGRIEEAVRQDERAVEIDPLSVFANAHLGWTLIGARQYSEAVRRLGFALELDPLLPMTNSLLGVSYALASRPTAATKHGEQAVEVSDREPWFLGVLGWIYGWTGREDDARAVLSELSAMTRKRYVRSYELALVHTGLGEVESALSCLRAAQEERDAFMAFLPVDPRMDPLRQDPRFEVLLNSRGGSH